MDSIKTLPNLKKISGDRKVKIIVLLGLAGMVLILVSQFFSSGSSKKPVEIDTATAQFTTDQYIADLEEKLTNLITGMEGVGQAKVMVTLESGVEYQYVQEEKRNVDKTQEGGTTEVSGKVYQKENIEQTYILVDTEFGQKQLVLKKELQPKIQGVVIVCEGAGNIHVQQNLTNVVTTALNIPTTRVCVVKIS